jgi:hypothetical protein
MSINRGCAGYSLIRPWLTGNRHPAETHEVLTSAKGDSGLGVITPAHIM